jgi:hypothetical protein
MKTTFIFEYDKHTIPGYIHVQKDQWIVVFGRDLKVDFTMLDVNNSEFKVYLKSRI